MLPLLFIAAIGFTGSALADPIAPGRIRVIDGDTIEVDGRRPHVRLVGLNTPETAGAECPQERELGLRAARRLRQLVSGGGLQLEPVRCSCPPGTEGTPRCNHGRFCAVLRVRGRDVADILIREGLAVPFRCGVTSCPALPRPWCV